MKPSEPKPEPVDAPDASRPVQFEIDTKRLVYRLAAVWICIDLTLVLLDYHVAYSGVHIHGALRRLTNVAREDSLANLVAVLQVFMLAMTLWLVYFSVRKAGGTKWQRRGWAIVALLFSYMTIDDGARMHERFGSAFGKVLEAKAATPGGSVWDSFPSYTWQVVFLPFFAALGLFTLYFLWTELNPRYLRWLVFVGIGCFVVAVGMDFFEGLRETSRYNPYTWIAEKADLDEWAKRKFHSTPYHALMHFSKNVEEVMEMFGITLIWIAVISHWSRLVGSLRFRFNN